MERPIFSARERRAVARGVRIVVGSALLLAAGVLAISLLSYAPTDPGFYKVGTGAPANWLGRDGALIADVSILTLGYAAFSAPLLCAVWGALVLHDRIPPDAHRRLIATPFALLAGAAFASSFAGEFFVGGGHGGLIGDFIFGVLAASLPFESPRVQLVLASIVCLAVLAPLAAAAFGLRPAQARAVAADAGWHFGRIASWMTGRRAPDPRRTPHRRSAEPTTGQRANRPQGAAARRPGSAETWSAARWRGVFASLARAGAIDDEPRRPSYRAQEPEAPEWRRAWDEAEPREPGAPPRPPKAPRSRHAPRDPWAPPPHQEAHARREPPIARAPRAPGPEWRAPETADARFPHQAASPRLDEQGLDEQGLDEPDFGSTNPRLNAEPKGQAKGQTMGQAKGHGADHRERRAAWDGAHEAIEPGFSSDAGAAPAARYEPDPYAPTRAPQGPGAADAQPPRPRPRPRRAQSAHPAFSGAERLPEPPLSSAPQGPGRGGDWDSEPFLDDAWDDVAGAMAGGAMAGGDSLVPEPRFGAPEPNVPKERSAHPAPLAAPLPAAHPAPHAALSPRPEPTPDQMRGVAPPPAPRAPAQEWNALAQDREPPGFSRAYHTPPLELLTAPAMADQVAISEEALARRADELQDVLGEYGVKGDIVDVHPGPVVSQFELEPAPGLKAARVVGLADDIARSMSAISARIATVPGRNVIGIELPNADREIVRLRGLLEEPSFAKSGRALPIALGKDIAGAPVVADLAGMPHLLIAGTTGSGKSVAINTMLLSLLYSKTPEEARLILIDPKRLELSVYHDIPHLLGPVVTDPKKAVSALKWVVGEMERRYTLMSRLGVRNLQSYNQRLAECADRGEPFERRVQTGFDETTGQPIFETQRFDAEPMPYIVVVIDEMADLMLVAGKEIEHCIQRLAQMARASGIHLVMATQRPSVDVITGVIKANFPIRISFQVTSKIDSRTILGESGAEQLLGKGDMLFTAGGGRLQRIHGPFVSDEEVDAVARRLRSLGPPDYRVDFDAVARAGDAPEAAGAGGAGAGAGGGPGSEDMGDEALFDQAVDVIQREGRASTSLIQRRLKIGYNRAARIVELMEERGLVSAPNHVGKREVLAPGPHAPNAGDHGDAPAPADDVLSLSELAEPPSSTRSALGG